MALLGNIFQHSRQPLRHMGGTVSSCERSNFSTPGQMKNQYTNAYRPQWVGQPNGYLRPGSWNLPLKPGGMSSYKGLTIDGTLTASGDMGVYIDGDTAITVTLDATGSLIVAMIGAILIDCAVAGAMEGIVEGTGDIPISATIALTTGSSPGALVGAVAAVCTFASTSVEGLGDMTGEVFDGGTDAPTADQIAAAVWAFMLYNSLSAEDTLVAANVNAANAFAVSA